jgi:FkbM family methyltransferase
MTIVQVPAKLRFVQTICRRLPPLLAQRVRTWLYPLTQASHDDWEYTVRAQTGSLFCGRTSDFHGYPFSVQGCFDWRNWAVAAALCTPGDTIVEIGANIGTETVGFRDIVAPSGRVFAFEPLPSNVIALRRLVTLNRWRNVRVVESAMWRQPGKMRFVLPAGPMMSGVGHIQGGQEQTGARTTEVECSTIDEWGDAIGAATAVFVDAEGAEAAILEGGVSSLRRWLPALVIEASPKLLARAGASLTQLYCSLQMLGYVAFAMTRLGLSRINHPTTSRAINWFCLPVQKVDLAKAVRISIWRCGLLPCVPSLNPLTRG